MATDHLSTTALNVLSRVWRRLLQRGPYASCAMQEVVELCREPCSDQAFGAYFAAGTDMLRDLLTMRRDYFRYEPSQGTVGVSEASVIIEGCLVEFVALKLKAFSDPLDIGSGFEQYERILPRVMGRHMCLIYGESLELFLKTHQDCFVFYNNGKNVRLAEGFEARSMLACEENTKLVFFFPDLLQKLGATGIKPCPVSLLAKSRLLRMMDSETCNFFTVRYGADLSVFLLLNSRYLRTNKSDGGKVYRKVVPTQRYIVIVYLKWYLQTKDAISCSASLALEELVSEGRNSQLPRVQSFFVGQHQLKRLAAFLKQHPNTFEFTVPERVFLTKAYRPWKDKWTASVEMCAVRYFIALLRDVGFTCPCSPICFDYIFCCVESAPPECRDYLVEAFPDLDIIDLFHLCPETFDLSSLNCVSLKPLPVEPELQSLQTEEPANVSADKLAVRYAARLLRYAPGLTPSILLICSKTAPLKIATYCQKVASKRNLGGVLKLARKLLDNKGSESNPATSHAWSTAVDTVLGTCSGTSTPTSGEELHPQPDSEPNDTASKNGPSDQHNVSKAAIEVAEEGATTACPQTSEGPPVRPSQQALQENELVQAEPRLLPGTGMTAVLQTGALGSVCL